MLRLLGPRMLAPLFSVCVMSAPLGASSHELNPVRTYASVLRVFNPHLAEWQRQRYAASILANAQRTKVDPRFIMAVVAVESSWRANAVSRVGARGLGQLMPGTAAALQVNARDASQNLRGTANYLKLLLDRFRGQPHWFEKAIAGYNAGPRAVERYGGIPPYAETQRYVSKVLGVYERLYGRLAIAWSPYRSHGASPAITVPGEPSAMSDAARDALPNLPIDAIMLAPIPDYKPAL